MGVRWWLCAWSFLAFCGCTIINSGCSAGAAVLEDKALATDIHTVAQVTNDRIYAPPAHLLFVFAATAIAQNYNPAIGVRFHPFNDRLKLFLHPGEVCALVREGYRTRRDVAAFLLHIFVKISDCSRICDATIAAFDYGMLLRCAAITAEGAIAVKEGYYRKRQAEKEKLGAHAGG